MKKNITFQVIKQYIFMFIAGLFVFSPFFIINNIIYNIRPFIEKKLDISLFFYMLLLNLPATLLLLLPSGAFFAGAAAFKKIELLPLADREEKRALYPFSRLKILFFIIMTVVFVLTFFNLEFLMPKSIDEQRVLLYSIRMVEPGEKVTIKRDHPDWPPTDSISSLIRKVRKNRLEPPSPAGNYYSTRLAHQFFWLLFPILIGYAGFLLRFSRFKISNRLILLIPSAVILFFCFFFVYVTRILGNKGLVPAAIPTGILLGGMLIVEGILFVRSGSKMVVFKEE